MEKLIAQFNAWSYLDTLSSEVFGFKLLVEHSQSGSQYRLFSYRNESLDKTFVVLYDSAAKEFLARWRIGLIEFCDINFIAPDISTLEQILKARLDAALRSMAVFEPATLGSVFLSKKVLEWPYADKLPVSLVGFSLFISPQQPLKAINGSYIIIDYSDFIERSNLLIYYNIFRDEFYGEYVFRGTPEMTTLFDSEALNELEDKLKSNLELALTDMRKRLG